MFACILRRGLLCRLRSTCIVTFARLRPRPFRSIQFASPGSGSSLLSSYSALSLYSQSTRSCALLSARIDSLWITPILQSIQGSCHLTRGSSSGYKTDGRFRSLRWCYLDEDGWLGFLYVFVWEGSSWQFLW